MKMSKTVMLTVFASLALAAGLLAGAGRLLADTLAAGGAPNLISHQGYLTDSGGNPLADASYPMKFAVYDAASSGTKVWEETHASVPVGGGYFAVLLGSGTCTTGCPLDADTFESPTRYLQTSVDAGGGYVDFPRQRLTSAPYALQAQYAASVPWSGITGVPGDLGGGLENVITVAKSGGDFTSVAEALDSITSSSASNRYLVAVAPGVYTETLLVDVPSYVHLRGSGPNATVVSSSRTGGSPNNAAATVDLQDNSRISDLTVRNLGTGTFGIGIYSALAGRGTLVDNVVVEAIGPGGVGHYAAYMNDAEPTITGSTLRAGGATGFGTGVNAAFGSVNISGGFPSALILDSILLGGGNNSMENCNDNTGTGFGMQLSNSSPVVRHSYICGGHRTIGVYTNGNAIIEHSALKVSTTGSAFMFETPASGSISVASSGLQYVGNKHTGAGTGLRCVHNHHSGTFAALSNGTTVGTACN